MDIKGAIFDMDGTLIDSLGFWEVLFTDIAEDFCGGRPLKVSEEDNKAVRTLTLKSATELICKNYSVGATAQQLLEYAEKKIAEFYRNDVLPKEGVIQFLETLSSMGVKMCLASATAPHLVKIAMESCGLAKFFPQIISCSTIGAGKDKPDVFLAALDYLGTPKESTWVFEDSLVALETASATGFKTVGVYDCNTDNQSRTRDVSTIYIAKDETLLKLV